MTTPSGLLKWGQAGSFNAVDDREVIRALATGNPGLANGNGVVVPPTLTPGAGLVVNVVQPWLAVVACNDGTSAVIGARQAHTVTPAAGPATGSRTDIIWADINPDAATWTLALITAAQSVGRFGVAIGTITAPAGANLASQMTLVPTAATFGRFYADNLAGPYQTINTSAVNGVQINGLAVDLPVGRFHVRSRQLVIQSNVNATGYIGLMYSAASGVTRVFWDCQTKVPAVAGAVAQFGNFNGLNQWAPFNPGISGHVSVRFEGMFITTAPGRLQLNARMSGATGTFECWPGGFLEVIAVPLIPV